MPNYKFFDHTADIGVEISGRTKKELFANAAIALFDILIENNDKRNKTSKRVRKLQKTLTIEGADVEDLLINYLRELLYLFNGANFVTDNCEIMECYNKKLKVRLTGELFTKMKHAIKTEVKAITYSGLNVEKQKSGWKARIIFDV
jgi:SHS2 domain-containing protein